MGEFTIELAEDNCGLIAGAPVETGVLYPSGHPIHSLRVLGKYPKLASQKLKENFYLIGIHGFSDGANNYYGSQQKFFTRIHPYLKQYRNGRSILYISCYGGEQGVSHCSRLVRNTPVVGCGSYIIVSADSNRIAFRSDPFNKTKEKGLNLYRNWVIGYNGRVSDFSTRGMKFDDDFFIEQCRKMKGSK